MRVTPMPRSGRSRHTLPRPAPPPARGGDMARPADPERGKIVTAADAVRLIRRGATIATGGFVGIGFAEGIAVALEQLFLDPHEQRPIDERPRDLTLVFA